MSLVKIWIHAVWTTKKREPLLLKGVREIVFRHIKANGKQKGIYIDSVNGYAEHVHCLFCLPKDKTIIKCVQLLKGESAYWTNKKKLLPNKLIWQKEYYAVSVSESAVKRVKAYIDNQEAHHDKRSWSEEYQQLISLFGDGSN